ncbi:50S ribosomal protein L24 [Patescibacteria group bacterium]|nr:50S ribosomal protein L24 [Patescibacteria group bacterium]
MHVKKGDTVVVLTGTDKGKTGAILRSIPKENKVVVAGVHIRSVHTRSNKGKGKGTVVKKEMPIHASNVRKADAPKAKKQKRNA